MPHPVDNHRVADGRPLRQDVETLSTGSADIANGVTHPNASAPTRTPPSGPEVTQQTLFSSVGTETYLTEPHLHDLEGGRLLMVFRAGSDHSENSGRLVASWSDDWGETWSDPVTVVDSSVDDRNHIVLYDPSVDPDRIVVLYREWDASAGTQLGEYQVVSTDQGETWGSKTDISSVTNLSEPQPFGPTVQTSNGMAIAFYQQGDVETVHTTDAGQSYSTAGQASGTIGREPVFVAIDEDRLVCFGRSNDGGWNIFKSTDGGLSWSGSLIDRLDPLQTSGDGGGVPIWAEADQQTNELTIAYGSRAQGLLAMSVVNAERFWDDIYAVERAPIMEIATRTGDFGYPSFTRSTGTSGHLVAWYSEPSGGGDPNILLSRAPYPTGGSWIAENSYVSPWMEPNQYAESSVAVSATSWYQIYTGPGYQNGGTVISGHVNGPACSAIRFTYTDGSTTVIGSTGSQTWVGDDGAGNAMGGMAIPPARRVDTIEIYNESGSQENYGYHLTTLD